MNIYTLAYQTWEDLNEPCNPTASYISGWFMNDVNIGRLNNTLNTCFSGVGGEIQPEMDTQVASIYSSIYKQLFYQQQVQSNLGAGGVQWTELREGDSTIRRASPTETAKVYKDLLKEVTNSARIEINSYKKNAAFPRTVSYDNP